jgi:hypothetical protein
MCNKLNTTEGELFTDTIIIKSNGLPFDCSAFTEIKCQVKKKLSTDPIIVEFKKSDGTFVLAGTNNNELRFNKVMLIGNVGTYKFDIVFINASGGQVLIKGTIFIEKRITVI